MYVVELETDVNSQFIKIPEYEKFKGKHLKVIFMSLDEQVKDEGIQQNNEIKQLLNKISKSGGFEINNPVAWQKGIRSDRTLY